jgi:hypothetical protein
MCTWQHKKAELHFSLDCRCRRSYFFIAVKMMGGRQQQFEQWHRNGYGLSNDGGYDGNYDYDEPSHFHGWQGNIEDFRQRHATPYAFPRNRQALGDYDRSHTESYKDGSELLERQLTGYQMNASAIDFGWQNGSSDYFRHVGGRGVLAYGGQRDYKPRVERDLRRQPCDHNGHEDEKLEKRFRGYRMNGSVNDFGWQSGSSEYVRQMGRGMSGSSTGGYDCGEQRYYTPRAERELRQQLIDSANDYGRQIGSSENVRQLGRGMSRSSTGGHAYAGLRDHTLREERDLRQHQFDRDGFEDDLHQGRSLNSTRDFTSGRPTSSFTRNQHRFIPAYRNDSRQGRNQRERGRCERGIDSRDDNGDDFGYDDDHSLVGRNVGSDYDRWENVAKLMNKWRLWNDNYYY